MSRQSNTVRSERDAITRVDRSFRNCVLEDEEREQARDAGITNAGSWLDDVESTIGYDNTCSGIDLLSLPSSLQSGSLAHYQYQPLEDSQSIRLIELLPVLLGTPQEEIRISLHHQTLSDLPSCEALSYEWGKPFGGRADSILCDGKLLHVTTNLYKALKILRRPYRTRPLWVDAICINQGDVAERSQQVPLMRTIYQQANRVLIWLGEEKPYTKEAFNALPPLAETYKQIESSLVERFGIQSDLWECSSDLYGQYLQILQSITKEPFWEGIIDLFSTRTYLSRLWIIQEVVLATNAIVLCGSHYIDWETFANAAHTIRLCKFLDEAISSLPLEVICHIDWIKRSVAPEQRSFYLLLNLSQWLKVSDPRDRVYGILGMLSIEQQRQAPRVDYSKDTRKVFQEAAESIIVNEQTLNLWELIFHAPTVRPGQGMPSWVPYFGIHAATFLMKRVKEIESICDSDQRIVIDGDILKVQGFIFDSIAEAFENFSELNFKQIILAACDKIGRSRAAAHDTFERTKTGLWQALLSFESETDSFAVLEQEFQSLTSWWVLEHLGLTPEVVAQNPKLKVVAEEQRAEAEEGHSPLAGAYPEETKGDQDVQWLVSRIPMLQWMLQQLAFGNRKEYERRLKRMILIRPGNQNVGRNVFKSTQGYVGLGPAGGYEKDPAVQVGDVIALLAKSDRPVILRLRGDGTYTLIGLAYVGCMETAPCFQDGNLLNLMPICIR